MLSQRYVDMLSEKDIIFEIAGFGKKRAQEIGAENVYDFSLGNPSVPSPPQVRQAMEEILRDMPPSRSTATAPAPVFSGPGSRWPPPSTAALPWTTDPSTSL